MSSTIADLEARLASVERRLAVLEGGAAEAPGPASRVEEVPKGDGFAAAASAQVGRVLLIFGGAFLLRAITDAGFVPTAIGLLLGAAYAVFWLFAAFRTALRDHTRASFLAGTSVLLALPLLHEAATTFGVLSGPANVAAVAIFCALALTVAAVRDLKVVAWLATAGGIAAGVASLVATHAALAVATFLLLLGLATMWIVYRRGWLGLQWLGAFGANIGVLALVGLSLSEQWGIAPYIPVVFAAALLTTYLGSFTYQTHVRGRLVNVFEAVQTLLAGGIVLGASGAAIYGGHLAPGPIGVLSLVLGVGGYALAVTRETRQLRYRNFFYYAYFGLVFVLTGTALLLPVAAAAVIWALLAMVMAWSSYKTGWVSLSLQCTVLLVAAGAASGLLVAGFEALVGDPSDGWVTVRGVHVVVALATVACLFIPVAHQSERWGTLANMPQMIVLALATWEVGGLAIAIAAVPLAGAAGDAPNMAYLAALRTAVLSLAAVTMAVSSQYRRWPEARYLVYPLLVLVCIKLFVEDVPLGHPGSLFVALAFIGTALLLAAPLMKRSPGSSPGTGPREPAGRRGD
ncbi:MAG: hypothetical protein P8Y01_06635 [Woeseiaceae bacterium]|jgi:hypothetical protein